MAAGTYYAFTTYVVMPGMCFGASNRPNYFDHDVVLISHLVNLPDSRRSRDRYQESHRRWWRRWFYTDLRRGDMVSFIHPTEAPETLMSKRVYGIPGDTIIPDPCAPYGDSARRPISVPPRHLWVGGDNYEWSNDSRAFGCVSYDLVEGKIIGRLLPFYLIGQPLNGHEIYLQDAQQVDISL